MTVRRSTRDLALVVTLLAALGVVAVPALAAPVRLTFTRVVDFVYDSTGLVDDIMPGTTMTATVVYDPEALVPYYTGPVENGEASYYSVPAPPASFAMQVGNVPRSDESATSTSRWGSADAYGQRSNRRESE